MRLLGVALLATIVPVTACLGQVSFLRDAAPDELLATFHVGSVGVGHLLIPLEVSGRSLDAMIDTGSAYTILDVSLRSIAGKTRSRRSAETPKGKAAINLFGSPELHVAGLPALVPKDGVLVADLSKFGQFNRRPIGVILGMDVLDRFVLRIDSRRAEVQFRGSVVVGRTDALPIRRAGGTPWILATWAPESGAWFQIDTGLACAVTDKPRQLAPADGNLAHGIFNKLESARVLLVDERSTLITPSGSALTRSGRLLLPLRVGKRVSAPPRFTEAEYCALGLTFFSRFIVTLDFPSNAAYIEELNDAARELPPKKTKGQRISPSRAIAR